jgi:hypothetical protein
VVRLNQPHAVTVVPSIHGDFVGHYEGDALIIDTVGIKLGPHRMIDPNDRGHGLQLEFTVEDPAVFTTPWSATITYGRNANLSWEERVCAENVQHEDQYGYFSEKDAHLPTTDKPDF